MSFKSTVDGVKSVLNSTHGGYTKSFRSHVKIVIFLSGFQQATHDTRGPNILVTGCLQIESNIIKKWTTLSYFSGLLYNASVQHKQLNHRLQFSQFLPLMLTVFDKCSGYYYRTTFLPAVLHSNVDPRSAYAKIIIDWLGRYRLWIRAYIYQLLCYYYMSFSDIRTAAWKSTVNTIVVGRIGNAIRLFHSI